MDPVTDEQLDYGDEEYGGNQKMQYHHGGAIPALAEDEMIGDDDEYDDLYNDVNVGEGFMQMQRSEAPPPSAVGNNSFSISKNTAPGTRAEAIASQEVNNGRVGNEGSYAPNGVQLSDQKNNLTAVGGPAQPVDASQRVRLPEVANSSQAAHLGYQGSEIMLHKTATDRMNNSENIVGEPASLVYPNTGSSKGVPQAPSNLMNSNANVNVNVNRSMDDEYLIRPSGGENGNPMIYVGELHWWTTDAEVESVLIQYGRVKEIKFFDERASGKSKGYCQVEFYDPAAATACKDGMQGHIFNGRACVVTYANPQTSKQMGASYNKNQGQSQSQLQGRNPMNDGAGRGNGTNYPSGDAGRNFGRGGGWGRGNQAPNRGPGAGPIRGRGGMGNKNMIGNAPGAGGGGAYGQGLNGPGFGGPPGMMHPQGMMGPGFDLAFMGRGGGYGGFSGPPFQGMLPPFQGVNSMGLPGVAPHVNPAFFGRGMNPNGMGMMGNPGMVGPHSGMWNDPNMGGWGGEEHGRESSYGGEDNASEYGYGEGSHDKSVRSSAAPREKERTSEREYPERKHREERENDGERNDRDSKYREEKDRYREHRHKERESGYDDDWDRGQSSRSRSRSGAVQEEDHRSRSRDADYGKRRRMPSE
ncbi:hypothetical protein ABFS82_11G064100 [Erythranthe guttata]|uniref:RRM domain-containing protein n=1 Tax=Erythranthe guttata TaxID=4155 RepID=A0A022QRQ3_ERYGU|nr:PREDICTED: cleavage and polyadenylation specificity factor subunit 6 [Erythranthe guttata]EYU30596.1 hypothetical protein MIMGU_mgv1a002773mg [Erythranthe guttata]|eukprot:XP_012845456.1 PREDICTED: cleavage and polyadenylation specificity factor subunit 6 [Erythranthe guttata]